MKPLHILLLMAAGAVGGAVIMKVVQRTQGDAAPSQVVAQAQAPVQAVQETRQAPPPMEQASTEQPVATPEPPPRPSPFPAPTLPPTREAPRPGRVHPGEARTSRRIPQPAIASVTAQNRASAPVTPTAGLSPAAAVAPVPEPVPVAVQEAPAPQPISPARPEPENATPPLAAPEPNRVTLNAGMLIPVRLVDGLSSERNMPGDTFIATLDKELVVDGFVIAERGARVEGRVVASDRGGKVKGVAALAVELTRLLTSDGQNVAIQTDSFEKRSEQRQRQEAETVGAGAAIGAVVGAMAGGGKGAAIGAGVGGGAGAGSVLLTRGDGARLPSETRISFRLRGSVTLTERTPG